MKVMFCKYSILILFTLCLSMSCIGCGKEAPDEVSQKMIDDIDSIGEVTIDDDELINKLISTYASLTDKQKENVTNYVVLLEAQDKVDELKKQKEESEAEELSELLNEEHVKCAIVCCKAIKKGLLNPNSFILKEIQYSDLNKDDLHGIFYSITYSGENKAGGMTETTTFVHAVPDNFSESNFFYEGDDKYATQLGAWINIADGIADDLGWGKVEKMDVDFIQSHIDD